MAQPGFDDDTDKPLDPAAERLRRRLLRFMVINLGLLFAAVMAVLVAIVYQASTPSPEPAEAAGPFPPDDLIDGEIALPTGARIRSHAVSGTLLSLNVELADGGQAMFVYDMAERRHVVRLDVTEAP